MEKKENSEALCSRSFHADIWIAESTVFHRQTCLPHGHRVRWPRDFTAVAGVRSSDPTAVFKLNQLFNELSEDEERLVAWFRFPPRRSTSVGDVIVIHPPDGRGVYRVDRMGFTRLA